MLLQKKKNKTNEQLPEFSSLYNNALLFVMIL